MPKIVYVLLITLLSFAIVSAQFFGHGRGFNGFPGDFGSSNGLSVTRDARQNRGPVVFPDPPSDAPIESSGVIVGASGYGFVPPSGAGQSKI